MYDISQNRMIYPDILRIVAMFAVIILHVSTAWIGDTPLGSINWLILCAYDALTRWCVPIFVMLSGMFMLNPNKQLDAKKLFKYILRIFFALIIWGFIYATLDINLTIGNFSFSKLLNALQRVLWTNTHYHLWYLYMLIGLYLIIPLLRAFINGAEKATLYWFFGLAILFTSFIPTLLVFRSSQTVTAWLNKVDIQMLSQYVVYFVAGYFLGTYNFRRTIKIIIYCLGICGALMTFIGNTILSLKYDAFNGMLFMFHTSNVAAMAVAIFECVKNVDWSKIPLGLKRLSDYLSKISFSIYLIHDIFIIEFRKIGITPFFINPLFSIPILSIAILTGSTIVISLFLKIKQIIARGYGNRNIQN